MKDIARRRVLRGMLAGGAVSLALPTLDCLLNESGSAFAATGAQLPTRFATWFWGLGLGERDWTPKTSGSDYVLPQELGDLAPLKAKMNLFTGTQVHLDGKPNTVHFAGCQGFMTGKIANAREYRGSVDAYIGEVIGNGTRFRSLEAACDGNPTSCWSAGIDSGKLTAEISPLAMYSRIFGPEFQDPNAAEFVPDQRTLLRKSVLSAVTEERNALAQTLGAADRLKLDNYFTALRAMENKLEIQLQKPEPLPACTKPGQPGEDTEPSSLATDGFLKHSAFTDLLVHALACGQTRVVNLALSGGASAFRMEGENSSHHIYSHEEPIDSALGYQKKCAWFANGYMKCLHEFVSRLDQIQEGEKTLLDRMIVLAFTDHGEARLHSLQNIPVLTFGGANGRMKTGLHIPTRGDPATRVSFTVQQLMGVASGSWGTESNLVTSPYAEVFA